MSELVEKRSVDRVPDSERTTGFWALFMLWTGFSISVGRLWQGGVISGAGFWTAIGATLLAQVLLTYVAIGAVMGASEGLPGTMIMRAAFGVRGRFIPSIPMIIATIGWFGLQLGITTSAVDIIIKNLYGDWGVPIKAQYIVLAVLMGIISIYGYKVVMWFQKFVSPLLLLLIPWMLFRMVTRYDVAAEIAQSGGGESQVDFFEAATILSGAMLAMLLAAADSSRYAKSRATAFGGFMAAHWTSGLVMFVVGLMGAVIVGVWDPAGIVDKLGLGLLGLIIVVFSAWSTNCLNPYWGGIALATLTAGGKRFPNGIPRATSTAFVVAVGALSAVLGIYSINGLMGFIGILAGTLGPANGIIIADYFFLRGSGTNKLDGAELQKVGGRYWYWKGWNPIAVIVWSVGVCYSLAFRKYYVLITPISAQIICGLLYYMLMKTAGRKWLARS
jgi:NCS1 nucleoside transporter family